MPSIIAKEYLDFNVIEYRFSDQKIKAYFSLKYIFAVYTNNCAKCAGNFSIKGIALVKSTSSHPETLPNQQSKCISW